MTPTERRQADILSVDTQLRCWIDAAGVCKDRQVFYNTLKEKGPQAAYLAFSNRVGINVSWLPQIKARIDNV